MNRPRLLVAASTFPGTPDDGTPAFVRDLALRESEYFDTLVVVPRVPGALREEQTAQMLVRRFRYFPRRWEGLAHGAIIENLRADRWRYLQVLPLLAAETWALARAVRTFKPDVMHVHWIIPQGVLATAVAPRIPKVVTTLGGDLYALNGRPIRALKRWVLRRADVVTVMNQQMRSAAVELGAREAVTRVLPMGANLGAVVGRPPEKAGGAVQLLFVGRLVEKKGLSILIEAIRSLAGTPDHHVVVVGDGPLSESLRRQAAGLPITFIGQLGRAALMNQYALSDIVVVPSVLAASGDQDGLPVALLEAMGSGCAVLASDLPGLNEVVTDGVTGVLVQPGDIGGLAASLADLIADPPRRSRLGEAAAEAAQMFSVDHVGREYTRVLADLARPGREAPPSRARA